MQKQERNVIRLFDNRGAHTYEVKEGEKPLQEIFEVPEAFKFRTGVQSFVKLEEETLLGEPKFGAANYFGEVLTADELKAQGISSVWIEKMDRNINAPLDQYTEILFAVKTRGGDYWGLGNGDRVYSPDDCRLVFEIGVDGRRKPIQPQPRP